MTRASGADRINTAAIGIVPEELTEDNYEDWKICLKHFLVGHGLWDVVSGKEPEPSKDKKKEHDEWKKKNALALHAIQLSCGPGIYAKFKEAHTSARVAWNHLAEKIKHPTKLVAHDLEDEIGPVEDEGSKEYVKYEQLYKAIEKGNLHLTKSLLQQDPNAVRAIISLHKDTALHIAILVGRMKIAEQLVKMMGPEDLEMVNEYGSTALTLAAISGVTKLAKALVGKNRKLVIMENEHEDGQLPCNIPYKFENFLESPIYRGDAAEISVEFKGVLGLRSLWWSFPLLDTCRSRPISLGRDIPVIVAALFGQKQMVHYLYRVTPKEELSPERGQRGVTLLNSLITAEIYDVALLLLQRYPKLGVTPDQSGDYTLRILAHKPSAFPSGTKLVFWKQWIYSCMMVHSLCGSRTDYNEDESLKTQREGTMEDHNIEIHDFSDDEKARTVHGGPLNPTCVRKILHGLGWSILRCPVPDIKQIHDRKLIHKDAIKLLTCIFQEIRNLSKSELEKMDIDKILYDSIEHGIIEFVNEIIKFMPEIIWRKDKKGRTIFSHAIVLRQEKIFSLIYALGTKKSILARRHDAFGNNFLHLAAKLSPPSELDRVSGAALQMQRELQWFQEVESIVQPRMKEEMNENQKTPSVLFSIEHKVLAKDGERWMKNTAGSSMIVGTLIAAVMFTTAFTVPGGNDSKTGLPVMLETERKTFLIFMASNALSMFTSSTSILMFLGILTARYAEQDFLKSLPTKLIFGIACLFVSIVTMMASFGTALYLMLIKQVAWVSYPIIVFSIIPIALFSLLQFPLLVEMISRTYGYGIFDKPRKKLFRFDF